MYGIMRGIKMKGRFVSLLLSGGLLLVLGGVAWCAEEGAHGAGHALNWSDFLFRALNFGLMLGILVKLLKKPAGNFFASRRENIQKLLAELEDKRREAEGKSAEYTAKLAALDAETASIVTELVQEGEAEKKKIIDAALRQADYIKQQAQLAIQQELKAARESLQEEITELSVVAAEELIRKKLRPEDQERLVRDFMTRVVEAK